ncbi:metal ABC transporter permease [Deinococcus daejeonensis]|uniref:UreE urease accessory N-terminal domain-containing protein n=1 Tax=Deinococcus daejeonensis TaxID=1007098 RepID=A0ABQ2JHM9_9DEIO|nr:metal ABC transporter permease [Deinococcus daejeonensis]GGN46995.1 hypothetical protein GCM10010842_38090 [Deinococcus daejeonensis]
MTRLSGLRRPVLGTVTAAGKVAGEVVTVPMTAIHRRRVRRRLRAPDGVELLLALPTGTVLTPGTLLEVRGGVSYVVGAAPEDVAVIRPSDMPEAAALGHAVGNLRRDLLLYVFDATHARSIGLNTGHLYGALLVILALTIVSALQTVGVILVFAMLITPGATAYLLTDRFSRMVLLAVTAGVLSSLIGTYASYFLDGATGACIVLTQSLLFGLAFLFAPKHGQLARRRQQHRERQAELNG